MQSFLLIAIACMIALIGGLILPAFLARRRLEFRAQIFDLLATAVRRGTPIGPLLQRAAREYPLRQEVVLSATATRLAEGNRLCDALEEAGPKLFCARTLASIRASEGTPQLAAVLSSLAHETARALATRHTLSMTLFYPVCLGLFLIGMQVFYADIAAIRTSLSAGHETIEDGLTLSRIASIAVISTWVVIGLMLAYRLVGFRVPSIRRVVHRALHRWPLVERLTRLVAGERLLRGASALVGAGLSLPDALRRAAPTTGDEPMQEAAMASADLMESGASADKAWSRTLLPEFAAVRAATATGAAPAELSVALGALADECGHRVSMQTEHLLRWVHPAAIAFFGALLALQFGGMFEIIYGFHGRGGLW